MKLRRAVLIILTLAWASLVWRMIDQARPADARLLTIGLTITVGVALSALVVRWSSWPHMVSRIVGMISCLVALDRASTYLHSGACNADDLCSLEMLNGLIWDVGGTLIAFVAIRAIGLLKARREKETIEKRVG